MWTAIDPLTEAIANVIEERIPGRIVGVEVEVRSHTRLKRGEYDIVGDDFVIEVTTGKGPGKVKQVARMAKELPTKRIAVFAPNPLFNPIARAELEAIANHAGGIRVFDTIEDLLAWIRSR